MISQYFEQNITQDLQSLLNTRKSLVSDLNTKMKKENVLLNYGIPDFSELNPHAASEREYVRQTIEKTIQCFEPRLGHVNVQLLPQTESEEGLLRLHISAQMDNAFNAENEVAFVSLFDPILGHFDIEEV